MKFNPGEVAWVSIERGVTAAKIIEVESAHQQMVRVQLPDARIVIRNVAEIHDTEREALVARLVEEMHWAAHYAELAERAQRTALRLRARVIAMDAAGPPLVPIAKPRARREAAVV